MPKMPKIKGFQIKTNKSENQKIRKQRNQKMMINKNKSKNIIFDYTPLD